MAAGCNGLGAHPAKVRTAAVAEPNAAGTIAETHSIAQSPKSPFLYIQPTALSF